MDDRPSSVELKNLTAYRSELTYVKSMIARSASADVDKLSVVEEYLLTRIDAIQRRL